MNADMETERNKKKPTSVFPGYGSYGFFFPLPTGSIFWFIVLGAHV